MFIFMGARCPDDLVFSSVLLLGRRVGDVIVWYQRKGCSMGLNGPQICSDRALVIAWD